MHNILYCDRISPCAFVLHISEEALRLGRIKMNQDVTESLLYYNEDGALVVGEEYRNLDPLERYALKTDYDWWEEG
jgi:hypothetical protein